ncbi:tRNA dimethylallyltransferase [Manduca sexta]|uniref:tRNA dimethylallyltransferase n=1 Tax=Manduca sexta TaxID=7130 RepID=UPI00188F8EF6|nr:tRNA dimethylallyltransferase [Manduca sexta]
MALRTVISSRIPMVIILGATGTGKTKLSLELAQRFEAEIINADSMQVYKGLDIVTAKATPQEREKAPHHLLDILEPHQMFTVVDFRNRALKIIEDLIDQGKIPLIVGGTNYYIESVVYNILVEEMNDYDSLLWDQSRRKRDYPDSEHNQEVEAKRTQTDGNKDQIQATTSDKKETDERPNANKSFTIEQGLETNGKIDIITKEQLQKDVDVEYTFNNEEIHAKLKAIDPAMAGRLHPNNRRKVLRRACQKRLESSKFLQPLSIRLSALQVDV